MSWMDLAILGGFGLFLTLAHKRGLVLEIADILSMILGGTLAFRLFRPISNALHNGPFSGFSKTFLDRTCLIVIFVLVFLTIFSIAFNLQRKAKEEKILEKDVDSRLGVVVGIPKTFLLITLLMGLIFHNHLLPEREERKIKRGPITSALIGMRGLALPFIKVAAPSDLADRFYKYGIGPKVLDREKARKAAERKQRAEEKKKKKKKNK